MTTADPFSTTSECGYLKPGIHPASREQIKHHYGTQHPATIPDKHVLAARHGHREQLFRGYERLSEAIELMGISTRQWIGGSFISHKPNPADVDLVNFCDVAQFESLPPEMKAMINMYFEGMETAKHCHCDSYYAPLPPEEHLHKADFQEIERYWKDLLGHDRAKTPKGIIETLIIPPATKQPDKDDEASREITS